jgi:hypothetical protein
MLKFIILFILLLSPSLLCSCLEVVNADVEIYLQPDGDLYIIENIKVSFDNYKEYSSAFHSIPIGHVKERQWGNNDGIGNLQLKCGRIDFTEVEPQILGSETPFTFYVIEEVCIQPSYYRLLN